MLRAAAPAAPPFVFPRHRCRRPSRAAASPPRACAVPPDARSVPLAAAHAAWSSGMRVLDVRSAREFTDEAIARAASAPLYLVPATIPRGAIDWALSRGPDKMPPYNPAFEATVKAVLGGEARAKATPALLVCSTGRRAAEAAALLAEEGYEALRWLEGGMAAWLEAYSPSGVPRKRVQAGVFRDTGALIWTDSAEEDTVLPAPGGNTLDVVD